MVAVGFGACSVPLLLTRRGEMGTLRLRCVCMRSALVGRRSNLQGDGDSPLALESDLATCGAALPVEAKEVLLGPLSLVIFGVLTWLIEFFFGSDS